MECIVPITVREVMAKKSRVKGESKAPEEETSESGKELYIPIPGPTGLIDFYWLFCGSGIVFAIIMIGYILLHYVLHIL
jgi:hypothetical protein